MQRIVHPLPGFHAFCSAGVTRQGLELLHRIKQGQRVTVDRQELSTAEPFYSLAAAFHPERVKRVCQKLTQHNLAKSIPTNLMTRSMGMLYSGVRSVFDDG